MFNTLNIVIGNKVNASSYFLHKPENATCKNVFRQRKRAFDIKLDKRLHTKASRMNTINVKCNNIRSVLLTAALKDTRRF